MSKKWFISILFFLFLKYKRYVFLWYSAPVINILRSIALIDWKQLMKYKDTIFSTTSKQINLGWTTHYQTQSAVNFVSFMSQIGYHFIIVYLILLLVSLIHICLARDILQGQELDQQINIMIKTQRNAEKPLIVVIRSLKNFIIPPFLRLTNQSMKIV